MIPDTTWTKAKLLEYIKNQQTLIGKLREEIKLGEDLLVATSPITQKRNNELLDKRLKDNTKMILKDTSGLKN